MTNEEIIAAICDIKSATQYVDAVAALGDEPAQTPAPEPEVQPHLKLENVRATLADLSRRRHTTEIRTLLQKHGAAKLSEIDPAHYEALLADAKELDHA